MHIVALSRFHVGIFLNELREREGGSEDLGVFKTPYATGPINIMFHYPSDLKGCQEKDVMERK